MNPWVEILESLSLSRTEQDILKRYKSDANGRSFLPISDILRSYKYYDESIELLSQGVAQHKGFTVARIILVRELFQKGLLVDAWQILEESTTSLRENVLAQKIKFKLSILLGYDGIAHSTYAHMKQRQMLDGDTKRIGEIFESSGIDHAAERLAKEMENLGVTLILPQDRNKLNSTESENQSDVSINLDEAGEVDDVIGGFQVIALDEVFHGEASSQFPSKNIGGIELDSTTLAEIYENQGHYEKALDVYRRLVKLTPSNEYLKAKVKELLVKKQAQSDDDLLVDPTVADSMEKLEMINKEIQFYENILGRLD